jgi:hypothetical protein
MIGLARCTPFVAGVFNFPFVDEPNLGWWSGTGGWQSGLLYADKSPKPALRSFLRARGVRKINCWALRVAARSERRRFIQSERL